jgi:hypothetical protein
MDQREIVVGARQAWTLRQCRPHSHLRFVELFQLYQALG